MGTQHANTACFVLVLALRALSCCVCSPSREAVVEEVYLEIAVRMKVGISELQHLKGPMAFHLLSALSPVLRALVDVNSKQVLEVSS